MMRRSESTTRQRDLGRRRPGVLWFGLLGGALAWFAQHSLGFVITEIDCHSNRLAFTLLGLDASMFLSLLLSLVSALVALGATLAAVGHLTLGLIRPLEEEPGVIEWRGRVEFMAYVGALMSLLFLIAIVANAASLLFLKPC